MGTKLHWWVFVLSLLAPLTAACALQSGASAVVPQEFRANLGGDPATIDPNRASWTPERTVIIQVFEGLLGFNQDLTLRPVGATEIPTVANKGISADGLTYTFKLRDGTRWSDGQPVTAKDYEYSIKRMLSPELAAPYASFYYDIQGAKDYNGAAGKPATEVQRLKDAMAVKAVDARTLQITLTQPRYTFLQLMALWPVFPVREDIITQNGDSWTEPATYIGNGPFKLTEWVHQERLILEPNPNYWGPKPKLNKIVLRIITDINTELAAYRNGELDLSNVPAGIEKAVMDDPALRKEILRYNGLVTSAFQFNVKKPPFDNVKLRQAIATAIDRNTFVDRVQAGVGKPALSWLPPGMPGYDPELGQQYAFNPTRARQLLAEAGYPGGKGLSPIKFQYANTGTNSAIAQFLQGQLKDNLGINVELEPMEPKAFSQMVSEGKHTWAWFGWGADYPDPDNWLPEVFGTGAGLNYALYSNPEFDKLSQKALAEPDYNKRLALWQEAQKLAMDDAPIVTMLYQERFLLLKPYVKGLKTTGMDGQVAGDFFWSEVTIDKH